MAKDTYDVREHGSSFVYIDTLCVEPNVAFNNAQDWIVKSSSSYKSSIQYENLAQKKLIAKSGIEFPSTASNSKNYLIFDLTLDL